MKKIFLSFLIVSVAGIGIFFSCKKEKLCAGCVEGNKPPIAVAGSDQIITLPADSVLLNGSASSDPDSKIREWLWTKIAGPASFNITRPTDSITVVKNLTVGIYQFQLRVKDNGGLSATDTVQIKVDSTVTTNHSPIANAGVDQAITLPVNTVMLDARASKDPDKNIVSYAWTKISGPSSFSITNTNSVQTQVTNLLEGVYQFELKVTDTGGLFAKDRVAVVVFATGNCNEVPISVINGTGTLIPVGSLSQARLIRKPTAAADKIVFGGGEIDSYSSATVDIYNTTTSTWSTATLSEPGGWNNVTAGDKIFYIGQKGIDMYDAVANTWSKLPIDQRILQRWPSIVATNNKVFFAGGWIVQDNPSSQVDIYDVTTNTWSTASLSEARVGITTITVGNKIIFAGGYKKWDPIDYPADLSKSVDIYDASTNTWSTSELPQPAFGATVAATGNKAIFHFENMPALVTIYDIATNGWSTTALSAPRYFTQVISVGNKILVAGGEFPDMGTDGVATVDIYDAVANSWSTAKLNHPGRVYWHASSGNKLLIWTIQAGFWASAPMNIMDIYDASSNTWSVAELNYLLFSHPVVAGNQIYLGGGIIRPIGVNDYHYTCQVWKFQF